MPNKTSGILVVYHAGCWDGFCAAWLLYRLHRYELNTPVDLYPLRYGNGMDPALNYLAWDTIYCVDILPSLSDMYKMARTNQLVLIDHHASARTTFNQATRMPNVSGVFDTTKSAGRLTWEWLHGKDKPAPWLVAYTEDRDLWRWQLPNSAAINAWLRSWPLDLQLWDSWPEHHVPATAVEEGEAILRAEDHLVVQHTQHNHTMRLQNGIYAYAVPAAHATCLHSRIAGSLANQSAEGIGAAYWFDITTRTWVVSLRSTPTGPDVSKLAEAYGGGGHKHAAGFRIENLP